MENVDLTQYSLQQLRQLQSEVNNAIVVREQEEVAKAREQILEIARNVGVSLPELLGTINKKGLPKEKGTAPVKFRHPDDPSKQWSGRGRQPGWVVEWINAGRSIDDIRV